MEVYVQEMRLNDLNNINLNEFDDFWTETILKRRTYAKFIFLYYCKIK